MKRLVTTLWALALAVLILGCASHHPRRLDCEGHLRPINPPAQATAPGAHP